MFTLSPVDGDVSSLLTHNTNESTTAVHSTLKTDPDTLEVDLFFYWANDDSLIFRLVMDTCHVAAGSVQTVGGQSGVTTADWFIPADYTGICHVYTKLHEFYPEIITTQ